MVGVTPLLSVFYLTALVNAQSGTWTSVLGDPGMTAALPSTAWTGWTFCNYAQGPPEYSQSPSPRMADCVVDASGTNAISPNVDKLGPGQNFPAPWPTPSDVNLYARQKELVLGSLCAKPYPAGSPGAAANGNWSHWSVMFKSGNMDLSKGLCPKTNATAGPAAGPSAGQGMSHSATSGSAAGSSLRGAPVSERGITSDMSAHPRQDLTASLKESLGPLKFNNLPMNQPLTVHGWSSPGQAVPYNGTGFVGYFAGTYDVDPSWSPQQILEVQQALHSYTQAWMEFRIAEIAAQAAGAVPIAGTALASGDTSDATSAGQGAALASTHALSAPARPTPPALLANSSFAFTIWYRNTSSSGEIGGNVATRDSQATSVASGSTTASNDGTGTVATDGGWVYYSALVTTPRYPWLMNYLRSNDVGQGGYGGYPWPGAGLAWGPMPSTGTNLSVRLRVLDPGARQDQFYLPEISGCWKLNGQPCDGDPHTDATRYICFIMAPSVTPACSATNQGACPPVHYSVNGTVIPRTDTVHFPYHCYYMHCPPWGCDAYSNPVPQELVQLLPCEEWGVHGFPTAPGQGWIGDDWLWKLDVGGLGARLYLEGQEPPAPEGYAGSIAALSAERYDGAALPPYPGWSRSWISFEVGPEQMDGSGAHAMVRWEVTNWDVQVLQAA